jgi:hypothetical protein
MKYSTKNSPSKFPIENSLIFSFQITIKTETTPYTPYTLLPHPHDLTHQFN